MGYYLLEIQYETIKKNNWEFTSFVLDASTPVANLAVSLLFRFLRPILRLDENSNIQLNGGGFGSYSFFRTEAPL